MVIEIYQIFINRRGLNSIEFEDPEIEIEVSPDEERIVEFLLVNYGTPTHVNLSVSDELKENVRILKENPYVKYEEVVPALVTGNDEELRGELIVTTGYGAHRSSVPLIIRGEGHRKERRVEVSQTPQFSFRKEVNESESQREHLLLRFLRSLRVLKYLAVLFIILSALYFLLPVFEELSFSPESVLARPAFWGAYLLSSFLTYLLVETLKAVYPEVGR
ncbi:MAG: hypothetical protein PWR13_676 [Archaeoglobi archaeon]|nr:hypothetical protein [Archaeoglobi archaeon]